MNFVFEDLEKSRNFVENWETNKSGSDRFTVAPLYNPTSRSQGRAQSILNTPFGTFPGRYAGALVR